MAAVESPAAPTRAAEPHTEAPIPEAPPAGIGQTVTALHAEVTNAVHERLHLAALEFRQVTVSATQMVMLAAAAGVMMASAWGAALIALYSVCTENGMPWGAALLLVLALNLAGTALAWTRAMALSKAFMFPATRRMLHGQNASTTEESR